MKKVEMLRNTRKSIQKSNPPKRLQIGEKIFAIVREEMESSIWSDGLGLDIENAAGLATEKILKIIQNNYRRRVY